MFVIDSSTDHRVRELLLSIKSKIGINVYFTTVGLSGLEKLVNFYMRQSRDTSHYLFKVDTDELLALYDPSTGEISGDPIKFNRYMQNMDYDGRKYRYRMLGENVISANCSMNYDTLRETTLFTKSKDSTFFVKHFFPSATFNRTDIGTHRGFVDWRFGETHHSSRIAMFHYHNHCFEKRIALDIGALVGRKYISGRESNKRMIEILNYLHFS